MSRHLDRAQRADELGSSALWLQEIPFIVPSLVMRGRCLTRLFVLACWLSRPVKSQLGSRGISRFETMKGQLSWMDIPAKKNPTCEKAADFSDCCNDPEKNCSQNDIFIAMAAV